MANRIKDLGITHSIHALIPVPLNEGREAERGYNQSLLLARVISEELNKPIWDDILGRKNFNRSQTTLGRDARNENMEGAFEYLSHKKVAGSTLILVDDIITTGATLIACTRALERVGASKVYGITWAAGYNTKLMRKYAGNWLYKGELK
jgi:ComF family protein